MAGLSQLFAYIGPETIVPATSILAAIVGFILAFGKMALQPVVRAFFWLTGKKSLDSQAPVTAADPVMGAAESPPIN